MTKNSELYPDFGKNIINEFETNYPQLSIEFKQIQQEQYKLFATKNARLWYTKHSIRFNIRK